MGRIPSSADFCRLGGISIRPFAHRQGGFPLPDFKQMAGHFSRCFCGSNGIFILPFAQRRAAGFSSGFYPLGRFSPPLIFAKARTSFPLLLRVKRDFHSAFCPTAGGGFFLRVFPPGFTLSADFSLRWFLQRQGHFSRCFCGSGGIIFGLLPIGGRRVFPPGFILSADFPLR